MKIKFERKKGGRRLTVVLARYGGLEEVLLMKDNLERRARFARILEEVGKLFVGSLGVPESLDPGLPGVGHQAHLDVQSDPVAHMALEDG